MKNINKKELIIKLIPLFITLLCCVILVSYAYYKIRLEGQKQHFVSSDLISFTYQESEDKLAVTNMLPIIDTDGKISDYFEFNVASNLVNNMSVDYEISILKTSTTNSFDEEDIKLYLTDGNDNSLLEPVIISELDNSNKINNAKVIYQNNFIYNNSNEVQTHTYRLRVWLKDDIDFSKYTTVASTTNETNISLSSYSFKFKVNVNTFEISAKTLIKLTDNVNESGLYTITHEADSTLQIGATESITEYRYRGASPKNYVTFNNEVWRIIGVFPTEDENGNIENRIKLIRNESIGSYYWDIGTTAYNYDSKNDNLLLLHDDNKIKVKYLEEKDKYNIMMTAPGPSACDSCTNNWARPATLNTYLNGTYYNGLDSTSQSMIGNAKYYLGGYNNYTQTPVDMYSYERKISGSSYYRGSNPNNWVGKIGLMYVSDYGYASSNCETKLLWNSSSASDDLSACNDTNWLYNGDNQWLLPQLSGNSFSAFRVRHSGYVNHADVSRDQFGVRPVLYLTSAVQITGGSGTSSSPYTLGR